MTKIDVLNGFAEVLAATHYRYNGQQTTALPYDLCHTAVEPLFERFEGWQSGLDAVRTFEELPAAAVQFLSALERYLGVPIRMVSTGPEREKLLVR